MFRIFQSTLNLTREFVRAHTLGRRYVGLSSSVHGPYSNCTVACDTLKSDSKAQ